MDAIKNLDVIGSEFKFKIEGGKLKTFIGGVITLVLLVISIITFLYFGQDLYLRVNPKYYTKQARTTEYPVKTLNSSQLFFAFAIKDQDNNPIDDQSYFVHNFNYITFLRDNTTGKMVQTTITTQMERCSTKHIEEYYLKKYELNTYYCHYFKELKLGGDFHANEMYIYKYSIDRCDSDISAKYGVICNDEDSVLDKYRDNIQ